MKNASQPILEKFLMVGMEKQKQMYLIFIMRRTFLVWENFRFDQI